MNENSIENKGTKPQKVDNTEGDKKEIGQSSRAEKQDRFVEIKEGILFNQKVMEIETPDGTYKIFITGEGLKVRLIRPSSFRLTKEQKERLESDLIAVLLEWTEREKYFGRSSEEGTKEHPELADKSRGHDVKLSKRWKEKAMSQARLQQWQDERRGGAPVDNNSNNNNNNKI